MVLVYHNKKKQKQRMIRRLGHMLSDKAVQSPDTKPGISANHSESMQKKIPFLS